MAIGIYADPPGRDEIQAALGARGAGPAAPGDVGRPGGAGAAASTGAAPRSFSAGSRSTSAATPAPLAAVDLRPARPRRAEAEIDEVLALAAEGHAGAAGGGVRAAGARGGSATGLTIAAGRYFRALYAAAGAQDGAGGGAGPGPPAGLWPAAHHGMAPQARELGPARSKALGDDHGGGAGAALRAPAARPGAGRAAVRAPRDAEAGGVSYRLIGHLRSPALRVAWALEELGLAYTLDPAAPQSEAALARNPSRKIPALVTEAGMLDRLDGDHDLARRPARGATYPAGTLERGRQDGFLPVRA